MRILLSLVLTISLIISQASFANSQQQKNQIISDVITKAMQDFQVPGVAVAIVKDNKVVMAQGYGVTNIETQQKVTPDTLFGIASNTKAMTAALLAKLVDEGKLSWHTKVKDIIPEFELYNPYVTNEFTITDLLSHNSGLGLGAGDLMIWPHTDLSTIEIIKRMRHLRPVSSFRSEFAYDNLMYLTAGEIIARLYHKPWQQVIQEQIFEPLGMTTTRAKFSLIPTTNTNVARAHVPLDGKLNVVGGNFLEKFLSAGAVASSVNDMSKWLMLQLNHGKTPVGNHYQLFTEKQSAAMWQPHTLLPVSSKATERDKTHFSAYGFGWFLNDYHGYKLVHHSGGILGMVSKVVLVPEANLGMVILTNQQSGDAFNAIYREILEQYLTLDDVNWVATYDKLHKARVHNEQQRLAQLAAKVNKQAKASLPLADFANTYHDAWYGDIEIAHLNNKLRMRFSHTPALQGTLEHYQYNTFIVRWDDRSLEADAYVTFSLDENGHITQATMKAVSSLTDFSFDFHDLLLKPKQ